jgi:hypothetical protein
VTLGFTPFSFAAAGIQEVKGPFCAGSNIPITLVQTGTEDVTVLLKISEDF